MLMLVPDKEVCIFVGAAHLIKKLFSVKFLGLVGRVRRKVATCELARLPVDNLLLVATASRLCAEVFVPRDERGCLQDLPLGAEEIDIDLRTTAGDVGRIVLDDQILDGGLDEPQ
nr:hypothetical protein DA06_16850 [Georgenia sp. SUBG003]